MPPIEIVLNCTFNIRTLEDDDLTIVWLNMFAFLMAGFSDFRRQFSESDLKRAFEEAAKSDGRRLSSDSEKLISLRR